MSISNPTVRDDGGGFFSIESESGRGVFYKVDHEVPTCSCPAFGFRGRTCKHIQAVKAHIAGLSKQAEQSGMTTEQSELLSRLTEAAGRMAALGAKAGSIGCATLETDLGVISRQLTAALNLQRRVLSPDRKVREAAQAEASLPFRIV